LFASNAIVGRENHVDLTGDGFLATLLSNAVTNARFAALHGLPVGPFSLSTTPLSLRKIARSSRAEIQVRRNSVGFRLRLGGGGGLQLHSARRSITALRSTFPLAARRPKPSSPDCQNCGQPAITDQRNSDGRVVSQRGDDHAGAPLRDGRIEGVIVRVLANRIGYCGAYNIGK
jgi:hypothetical protein